MLERRIKDLIKRGDSFYRERLQSQLEATARGQFVAVEPDSGSYYLGRTGSQAMAAARASLPGKEFFLARVGSPAAHTIGGYGTASLSGSRG